LFGQRVAPADPRQRGFSLAEETAAQEHGYSSEEIEGDFDSAEDEEKDGGGDDGEDTRRPKRKGDGSGPEDASSHRAFLVKRYDFDALSVRAVDDLWRRATILTTAPKPSSWIAHINSAPSSATATATATVPTPAPAATAS